MLLGGLWGSTMHLVMRRRTNLRIWPPPNFLITETCPTLIECNSFGGQSFYKKKKRKKDLIWVFLVCGRTRFRVKTNMPTRWKKKWQGDLKKKKRANPLTHPTLPSPPLCGGVHVSKSDWDCVSVLACSSALMRPQEVNEKAPQPFIPITIVSPYSGR